VRTARAQLAQTARRATDAELRVAAEQASQAAAQVDQQHATRLQAERGAAQARAQLAQLHEQRALAAKRFTRSAALLRQGYVAQADYDAAVTQLRVAEQQEAAQQRAVEGATASARAAGAAAQAAEANLRAQQAHLRTVLEGAPPEDVEVARRRVADAEEALRVAREQARNGIVAAPFDGTITAINAQVGQTVGAQGVAKLVSAQTEIRLDVDELNLGDLALGQPTTISSNAFPGQAFRGRVSRIGAAVDQDRGTVTVYIAPIRPPHWLRPGQTVDVTVVTARAVRRLLVPASAIARDGDRTVVYVVSDGTALQKSIVARTPTARGVPVLAGLEPTDRVIADASRVRAGDAVRVVAPPRKAHRP
jgi:HlyD family secretion protein